MDLLDVFAEDSRTSPRRVLTLLATLGDQSAYAASRQGDFRYIGWDYDRVMGKHTVDTLQHILFLLLKTNLKQAQARALDPPTPMPTPDEPGDDSARKKRKGQNIFSAMARAALDGQPE